MFRTNQCQMFLHDVDRELNSRTNQCLDKPVSDVSAQGRTQSLLEVGRTNQCSGQTSSRGFSLHEAVTPLKLSGQTGVRTKQCPDKAVPEVSARCRYSELNSRTNQCQRFLHEAVTPLKLSGQTSVQTNQCQRFLHEAITPLKLSGQKQCPYKPVPEVSARGRYSELNSLPRSKPDKLVPDKGTKAVHGYQVPALCLQRQISL